jgi:hypothetical protein
MTKDELIEKIEHIIHNTDDEAVLKDMLNLISSVYKHYTAGKWER